MPLLIIGLAGLGGGFMLADGMGKITKLALYAGGGYVAYKVYMNMQGA